MSEENKKLTDQELKKARGHQEQIGQLVQNIGVLEAEKHAALHVLATSRSEQEVTKKELEGKYGAVNINLQDGTYEEIKPEEVKEKNG